LYRSPPGRSNSYGSRTEDALHDAYEASRTKPSSRSRPRRHHQDAIALHYVRSPRSATCTGHLVQDRAGNRAQLLNEDRAAAIHLLQEDRPARRGMQVLEDLPTNYCGRGRKRRTRASVPLTPGLDLRQARDMLAGWSLEILKAPRSRRVPSATSRAHDETRPGTRRRTQRHRTGDANSVVLPLGHAMWPRSAP